jgi:enhancer of mRNA-decapping protein 4
MDRIFVLIHKHDCRLGAVSQQRISFIVMLQSLADFMHLQIFSIFLNTSDVNSSLDIASSGGQTKATASHNNTVPPLLPMSPRLPRKLSGLQSLSNSTDTSLQFSDHAGDQSVPDYLVDRRIETVKENASDTSSGDNLSKGEKNVKQTDIAMVSETPIMFKHPTHLITPSEILSRAVSSENSQTTQGLNVTEAKIQDVLVNNDIESAEVELKVVGETGTDQNNDFDLPRESHTAVAEKKEKSFYSQASDLGIQMARDCCVEAYSVGPVQQVDEGSITEVLDRPPSDEDEKQDMTKDVPAKRGEPETSVEVPQPPAPTTKAKKPKGKSSQVSVQSSPSPSPFNSTDSSKEPGCSPCAQSSDAALPQILDMQDTLDQVIRLLIDCSLYVICSYMVTIDVLYVMFPISLLLGSDFSDVMY